MKPCDLLIDLHLVRPDSAETDMHFNRGQSCPTSAEELWDLDRCTKPSLIYDHPTETGAKRNLFFFLRWTLDFSLPLQNHFFQIMMFIGRTVKKHCGAFFTPHTVTYFQLFREKKNRRDFPGDISHHVRNETAGARTSSPHRHQARPTVAISPANGQQHWESVQSNSLNSN